MKEIEVYVTAVSERFNFKFDENTPLSVLAEEVAAMIGRREQCETDLNSDKPLFYSKSRSAVLDMSLTLKETGIRAGELIYMV